VWHCFVIVQSSKSGVYSYVVMNVRKQKYSFLVFHSLKTVHNLLLLYPLEMCNVRTLIASYYETAWWQKHLTQSESEYPGSATYINMGIELRWHMFLSCYNQIREARSWNLLPERIEFHLFYLCLTFPPT
jgi:hypothetical protein